MLKESLIRDRIVVGVLDDKLSDTLQSKADLTLDKRSYYVARLRL